MSGIIVLLVFSYFIHRLLLNVSIANGSFYGWAIVHGLNIIITFIIIGLYFSMGIGWLGLASILTNTLVGGYFYNKEVL